MIDLNTGRIDMIPQSVPAYALAAMAVLLVLAWIGSHAVGTAPKNRRRAWGFFGMRVLLGTLAMWACFQLIGRFILLATSWSLSSCGFLSGLCIETVIWLYGVERRSVQKRTGLLLLGLRLTLLILVLLMLLQPVLSREVNRGMQREVVVMVDDSQSMHMEDRQLTVSEKLDVAELYAADAVKNRYRLSPMADKLAETRRILGAESEALSVAVQGKTPAVAGERSLKKIVEDAKSAYGKHLDLIEKALKDKDKFDQPTRDVLEDMKRRFNDVAIPRLGDALTRIEKKDGDEAARNKEIQNILKASDDAVAEVLNRLPMAVNGTDEAFYRNLNEQDKKSVDESATRSRDAIVRKFLGPENQSSKNLLEKLKDKYGVRMMRFASKAVEVDPKDWLVVGKDKEKAADSKEQAFRQKTDITAALEQAIKSIQPECLAGVLLLTDGQHNGDASVEPVARRLGGQRSPVCSIVVGGTISPKDASVLGVHAPESVYLGDKVGVKADIKLDGLRGQKVKVKLLYKDAPISEKVVDVPEDKFRTQVKFVHTPDGTGMLNYAVEIETMEGEVFLDNNKWPFVVGVSSDRTNVLIVEDKPRWEFRYLRNLFFGRDKSVHLQYVLLSPDRIADGNLPAIEASASRKFGDAEATALPKNKEEWMKFDVIILGDIPPSVLDDKTLEILKDCIADRGAMLAVIAGPKYMPHAYDNKILKDLLPIKYEVAADKVLYNSPEPMFRVALTPDGRNHVIMQESTSASENAMIWAGLPPMYWRHQITGTKEGATVLAYADPIDPKAGETNDVAAAANTLDEASGKLSEQTRMMKKNALVVLQKYAHGSVMMLNFDGIWRLRYKIGDTYHHKFWGQALRWGATENMRAGTECVRLGTDKIAYTPNDPVHVIARVTTQDYKPVDNDRVSVSLYLDSKPVLKKTLQFRKNSNGIYETTLDPLVKAGRYRIELNGDKAEEILAAQKSAKVETEILVQTKTPAELSELAADRSIPTKIAALSGGTVASISNWENLSGMFGPGNETVKERKDITLWDSWFLLLLIIGVVSWEWILRKLGGLI